MSQVPGGSNVCWATPLYEFLRQSNASSLERIVLDCGAGGDRPPLALFHQHGYEAYGLEIADAPLAESLKFCRDAAIPLKLSQGDMRSIPFPSESFSFVYSYNAVMFMAKPDIARALAEIERVLQPGGLCYVNFMSVDDPDDRPMREDAPLAVLLNNRFWSKYGDREADVHFRGFEILRREKRHTDKLFEGNRLVSVDVDYIARKRWAHECGNHTSSTIDGTQETLLARIPLRKGKKRGQSPPPGTLPYFPHKEEKGVPSL